MDIKETIIDKIEDNMKDNILKNKNCLITGATGGLGREIAIKLAKKGCNLFLTSKKEDLQKLQL